EAARGSWRGPCCSHLPRRGRVAASGYPGSASAVVGWRHRSWLTRGAPYELPTGFSRLVGQGRQADIVAVPARFYPPANRPSCMIRVPREQGHQPVTEEGIVADMRLRLRRQGRELAGWLWRAKLLLLEFAMLVGLLVASRVFAVVNWKLPA